MFSYISAISERIWMKLIPKFRGKWGL